MTWAGITAGKAQSFYSFIGGGDNWNNFFSPDQKGFNEPLLLAYTASFGGGFTATIAAQSQGTNGSSGGGTNMTGGYSSGGNGPSVVGPTTFGGQRGPISLAPCMSSRDGRGPGLRRDPQRQRQGLRLLQHRGLRRLSAVRLCDASESKVGWGVDAGVKVNLPSFGAGDDVIVTASFTQNAAWYSGLPDAMNGENGQVNGNGQAMILATPIQPADQLVGHADSLVGQRLLEHHWTPTFYTDLEGSVGGINWTGQSGGICVGGGGFCVGTGLTLAPRLHLAGWRGHRLEPVTNLNFDLELMYQHVTQDAPSGSIGTVYGNRRLRPRRLGRQLQRLPGPSPHHPLLLIASRSVESNEPRSESSGVFVIWARCDLFLNALTLKLACAPRPADDYK